MEVELTSEHKAQIKTLALAGEFDEIGRRFGPKWVKKAHSYLNKKANEDKGETRANNASSVPETPAGGQTVAEASEAAVVVGKEKLAVPVESEANEDQVAVAEGSAAAEAAVSQLNFVGNEETAADEATVGGAAEASEAAHEEASGDGEAAVPAVPLLKKKKKALLSVAKVPKAAAASSEDADAEGAAEAEIARADGQDAERHDGAPAAPAIKLSKPKKTKVLVPTIDASGDGSAKAKVPKVKKVMPSADGEEAAEAKGKGKDKGDKKPRAKTAPSAFMLYSSANREAVKAANPGISFADLGRQLGEAWRGLGPEDKAVWTAKHEEAKAALALAQAVAGDVAGSGEGEDAFPSVPADGDVDMAGGAGGDGAVSLKVKAKVKKTKGLVPGKPAGLSKKDRYVLKPAPVEGEDAPSSASKPKPKSSKPKKAKKARANEDEDEDSGSDGEGQDKEEGCAGAGSSKASGKDKSKSRKRGRGSRGDEDDEDSEAEDTYGDDEVIIVKDPRAEAIAAAQANKANGKALAVKNGFVVEDPQDNAMIMPRVTGRFDYKPYLPVLGETAVVVLPAYVEWREAITAAAAEAGPGSGAARVNSFLSLLETTGKITSNVEDLLSGAQCPAGVLLGRVEGLTRVQEDDTGSGAGAGASSSSSGAGALSSSFLSSSGPGPVDPFDDAASIGGSSLATSQYEGSQVFGVVAGAGASGASGSAAPKRGKGRQWHLLTLRLSSSATARGDFLPEATEEHEDEAVEDELEGQEQDQDQDGQGKDDDVAMDGASSASAGAGAGAGAGARSTKPTRARARVDDWEGETVTIPWLPPQDPCIKSFFVLTGKAYSKAVGADLTPGTQVRGIFAVEGCPSKCEYLEGRVYDNAVRKYYRSRGWPSCPYNSISTMWYGQLAEEPDMWFLEEWQTGNVLSPWDVTSDPSKLPFVAPANIRHFALGTPSFAKPLDVVDYCITMESAAPFKEPVNKNEPWAASYFARITTPMDLATMKKRARDGAYATAPGQLWEDFRTLIKNAKTFNAPDSLVWRQADEMQSEVRRLKKAYAGPKDEGSGSGAGQDKRKAKKAKTSAGAGGASSVASTASSTGRHGAGAGASSSMAHGHGASGSSGYGQSASQLANGDAFSVLGSQDDIDGELQRELDMELMALEEQDRAEEEARARAKGGNGSSKAKGKAPGPPELLAVSYGPTVPVELEDGDDLDIDMSQASQPS